MLRGASIRLYHNPLPREIHAQIAALIAAGCEAVAIIPHSYCALKPGTPALAAPPPEFDLPWWIYPDLGQDQGHPYVNTPNLNLVELAIMHARASGLRVILKPHVDSNWAKWRGYISVKDVYVTPPRWDVTPDFHFAYMERFLRPLVALAQRTHVPLVLGTELGSVTHELGAEFWIGVARTIRTWGFTGILTYAANWGTETMALEAFWRDPAINVIGCDWYVPADQLDAEQAALLDLQREVDKPLWFTEMGYSSVAGPLAAAEPWHDGQPGELPDYDQQAALIRAARARWEPHADAVYWWEAGLLGIPEQPVSHQLLGRPGAAAAWAP